MNLIKFPLLLNPVNIFKILLSVLVITLIAMPSISCKKSTVNKEEFGLFDTLIGIHITLFPVWDFEDIKPPVARITLQGNKHIWHFTRALYGKYRIDFLVDNLIDTGQPAYQDLEDYLGYNANDNIVNKPVAEVIDLENNKVVVKLSIAQVSDIVCSLDTGRLKVTR